MRLEELMIGNIVLYDGKPAVVGCLSDYDVKIDLFREGEDVPCAEIWQEDLEDCKPMPLTAEILHKNGFVRVGPDLYLNENGYHIFLNPKDPTDCYKEDFWLTIGIMIINIKYVHQLQNVFNVIGFEKKIVL